MAMTAKDELLSTFAQKKEHGLKDMKFFFGNVKESTVEDVCAEVNRLYAEEKKGNVKTIESWADSNRPT